MVVTLSSSFQKSLTHTSNTNLFSSQSTSLHDLTQTHFSSRPILALNFTAMKPFSARTLLLFSSSLRSPSSPVFVQISRFSASSPGTVSPYRRHEEDSKNVRVSVWWDFENCGVPGDANALKVASNIFAAVRANGIKGSIQITAFGDMLQLSRPYQEALSATGITLTHIPRDAGGKNSADRSLLVDLMYWVSENPPPAHLFLISGDRSFSNILHRLRMKNYNILLASGDKTRSVLCCAASIMWHWQDLATGKNLVGKHFNQPPDGPYGSWYGHYKAALEDPFPVAVQPACSQIESGSVPKTVLKHICDILNTHPEGIRITELREELGKTNISLDKDLYGHKKFSRFLSSMPHILNLEDVGNGQYMIRGITTKFIEPVGLDSGSSTDTNNGDPDVTNASLYDPGNSISESLDLKDEDPNLTAKEACFSDNSVANAADGKKLLLTPKEKVEKSSPEEPLCLEMKGTSKPCEKVVEVFDEQLTDGILPHMGKQDLSPTKVGLLHKIRIWWSGDKSGSVERSDEEECIASCSSQKLSHLIDAKCSMADTFGKTDNENKCVKLTNPNVVGDHPVSTSSVNNISDGKKIDSASPESYTDESSINSGFFNQIVKWCQSWKSSDKTDKLSEQGSERTNYISRHSGGNDLFATDLFWSNMEAFMNTPRGSVVVSQSITREELARNLHKEGPADLSSVSESDLLHLVDLLISEKKWVEECSSQTPPFKLVQTIGSSTCVDKSNGANGLSSIFMNRPSQSAPTKHLECNKEKRHQNIPHTVPVSPISKQPLGRHKSKVLADCHKLANEILEKHPEGYYMGYLRKRFHQRYGYSFDFRELGYDKLASLLQGLPGVKVASSHIFPSGYSSDDYSLDIAVPDIQEENDTCRVSDSVRDISRTPKKDGIAAGQWEELGPVSSTSENKLKPILKASVEVPTGRRADAYYEPLVSDDSDLEEDICAKVEQGKKTSGSEDSMLLQILGSWDTQREHDKSRGKQETVDEMADGSRNGLKPSGDSFEAELKRQTCAGNHERKEKLRKTYSFVAEPIVKNDKVIDEIVGTLKKSRMHNS